MERAGNFYFIIGRLKAQEIEAITQAKREFGKTLLS